MIHIEMYKGKSITEHPIEIVERKGTGHPDYICDSIMEAISVALSKEYISEFGTVLHHNIDKGLLAAGKVEKRFGGGRVIKPVELIIGDRATFRAAGKKIPVAEIAVATAKKWIILQRGRKIGEIARKVEEIIAEELATIDKFCMELSKGKYPIC